MPTNEKMSNKPDPKTDPPAVHEPQPASPPTGDEAIKAGMSDPMREEIDRQTHLVDPRTHPSSGDPPPALTPQGERLGAVPMTRNAIADTEQAKQEGLDAAEQGSKTKAQKQTDKGTTSTASRGHEKNDKRHQAADTSSKSKSDSSKDDAPKSAPKADDKAQESTSASRGVFPFGGPMPSSGETGPGRGSPPKPGGEGSTAAPKT